MCIRVLLLLYKRESLMKKIKKLFLSYMAVGLFAGLGVQFSALHATASNNATSKTLLEESCPELFGSSQGVVRKAVNILIPAVLGGCIGRLFGSIGFMAGLGFGTYVGITTGLKEKGIWQGCARSMEKILRLVSAAAESAAQLVSGEKTIQSLSNAK